MTLQGFSILYLVCKWQIKYFSLKFTFGLHYSPHVFPDFSLAVPFMRTWWRLTNVSHTIRWQLNFFFWVYTFGVSSLPSVICLDDSIVLVLYSGCRYFWLHWWRSYWKDQFSCCSGRDVCYACMAVQKIILYCWYAILPLTINSYGFQLYSQRHAHAIRWELYYLKYIYPFLNVGVADVNSFTVLVFISFLSFAMLLWNSRCM